MNSTDLKTIEECAKAIVENAREVVNLAETHRAFHAATELARRREQEALERQRKAEDQGALLYAQLHSLVIGERKKETPDP